MFGDLRRDVSNLPALTVVNLQRNNKGKPFNAGNALFNFGLDAKDLLADYYADPAALMTILEYTRHYIFHGKGLVNLRAHKLLGMLDNSVREVIKCPDSAVNLPLYKEIRARIENTRRAVLIWAPELSPETHAFVAACISVNASPELKICGVAIDEIHQGVARSIDDACKKSKRLSFTNYKIDFWLSLKELISSLGRLVDYEKRDCTGCTNDCFVSTPSSQAVEDCYRKMAYAYDQVVGSDAAAMLDQIMMLEHRGGFLAKVAECIFFERIDHLNHINRSEKVREIINKALQFSDVGDGQFFKRLTESNAKLTPVPQKPISSEAPVRRYIEMRRQKFSLH